MTLQQARNLIARHIMVTRRWCRNNPTDWLVQYQRTHSYADGVLDAYSAHGLRYEHDDFMATLKQIDSVIDGLNCFNRS